LSQPIHLEAFIVDGFLAVGDDILLDFWQVLGTLLLEILSEGSYFFLLHFSFLLDVFSLFALKIQNLFTHLEDADVSVVPLIFEPVNLFVPTLNVAPTWRILAGVTQQRDGLAHRCEHLRGGLLVAIHLADASHDLVEQFFVVGIFIRVLDYSVSNLFREHVDVFLLLLYVFLQEIGPLGGPGLDPLK